MAASLQAEAEILRAGIAAGRERAGLRREESDG